MGKSKGQAAMEFLMTYGWAILVVLIAIGALAYFGVLSPKKFLPSSCIFPPGVGCDSFKAEPATVTLVVRNGMGEDLKGVTITVCGGSDTDDILTGDAKTFEMSCDPALVKGEKFKDTINIVYTDTAGIEHAKTGQIVTEVE